MKMQKIKVMKISFIKNLELDLLLDYRPSKLSNLLMKPPGKFSP